MVDVIVMETIFYFLLPRKHEKSTNFLILLVCHNAVQG